MTIVGSTEVADLMSAHGLSERDAREVNAFGRFLREVGEPSRDSLRSAPGWRPYVLGLGPWPDEGYGDQAITAWTLPG